MDTRKRGRPEAKANGGAKRSKSESQLGSKSKPCMKFFSMDGCPFGEKCHFHHFFPGGYNAVAQMMNLPPASAVRTPSAPSTTIQDGSSAPATKSKMCNKYNTAEGCKFGDKCHFAHGAWDLGKPIVSSQEPIIASRPFGNHMEPPPPAAAAAAAAAAGVAASFGASATAKISVDASLAGAIIGKGGVNSKQICRETGVKLAIRDHESDGNLRNIELEGTFDQIKEASGMVRELIVSMSSTTAGAGAGVAAAPSGPLMSNNYKTKLCENFAKGCCTFGERCHFAHGNGELRKSGVI